MTGTSDTYAADNQDLRRQLRQLAARNAKLAELLKASRDKLAVLNEELEELASPPSVYGTYLEPSSQGRTAEIFASNRRMRVVISPQVDRSALSPGTLVRLGEGSQIVEACGPSASGQVATVKDALGAERAIVVDSSGEEHVVRLAPSLVPGDTPEPTAAHGQPRPGDAVLVDLKAGVAFEKLPRADIAALALAEIPEVTYADIGGLASQIDMIHDAVELPFSHPELYRRYNLRPPKGVLLYGPPGCGKTLIAKAVANSLAARSGEKSYFINVKGPELLNKFVGETERQIRAIFERARELAQDGRPVVVFFDEMESIFRTRGSGVSSDMETTVVPQLLAELDGVEGLDNVIIIGATNREELIDPAILRPGRLDVKVRINRPDKKAATDIFTRYVDDSLPLAVSPAELIATAVDCLFTPRPFVELTLVDGSKEMMYTHQFLSGALIANVVDRAKKLAIKEHLANGEGRGISCSHIVEAVETELRENEDLPNTANPDEWSRITGRHGAQVVHARVLALD